MKLLLAQKAPRLVPDGSNAIKEWQSSEHHSTHEGQVEFMARMKARMAAAQSKPVSVTPIRKVKS